MKYTQVLVNSSENQKDMLILTNKAIYSVYSAIMYCILPFLHFEVRLHWLPEACVMTQEQDSHHQKGFLFLYRDSSDKSNSALHATLCGRFL